MTKKKQETKRQEVNYKDTNREDAIFALRTINITHSHARVELSEDEYIRVVKGLRYMRPETRYLEAGHYLSSNVPVADIAELALKKGLGGYLTHTSAREGSGRVHLTFHLGIKRDPSLPPRTYSSDY